MGVRLLHRTTRRVALSTAGAALYEKVSPLLASLERSVADVPELSEQPSGVLRVTATLDFGAAVLAALVPRFNARYPDVTIDLRLTNEVVDLVAEGFDLALRMGARRLKDSSLNARSLGQVSMQLFASPGYLARRTTPRTPRDLAEHDWVAFRRNAQVRLESASEVALVTPTGRVLCDDMFFLLEAVRHGAGIGLLPTFLTPSALTAGELVRLLPQWSTRTGYLWLVVPALRHVPRKVAAFRDFLLESLHPRMLSPLA